MLSIKDLSPTAKKKLGIKESLPNFRNQAKKIPLNLPEYEILEKEDNDILFFIIHTRAIPKGRPRIAIDEKSLLTALAMGIKGIVKAKKSVSLKTPQDTKEYEKWIAHIGMEAVKNDILYDGFFGIDVAIQNPRQFSDIDNCLKAVMDGLNGIAYKDDKKVRSARITFHIGAPSVKIKVFKIIEED